MPNALAHEKSPYLLQHANNPVDWQAWGEPAFARARAEQKPIFLSIGYATCHWCHVMARESFENETVARVLNESFVPIKVDREERPDVDKVYMNYVQAVTGRGGWPLSAWLTPELKPFFGGTYFPPEDAHGHPGFSSLLRAIANGWANEREKLIVEGERVIEALRAHHAAGDESPEPGEGRPGSEPDSRLAALDAHLFESGPVAFEKCFRYFQETFDSEHGGFGGAPKFPRASNLDFLFCAAVLGGLTSETGVEAVKLATATCRAMACGGIHDHVGGGFHRYSVDEAWFVPHFEKMLYDQAQIAANALQAKQATGDERFAWMARDIFDYVLRDMSHPAGGFYSAEDADSAPAPVAGSDVERGPPRNRKDHAEGAFYVWSFAEIAAALGEDAPMFCAHFGVEQNGNVPDRLDPHGEFGGMNILAQRRSIAATANVHGLAPERASELLHAALEKLRVRRRLRPRPLLDDKIITAWNGLMISALAKGHHVLEGRDDEGRGGDEARDTRGRYLGAATRAAEFVERELYDEKRGVLFRSWRDGRSTIEGFADDYAFFVQGLIDLYEAGFDVRWLQWAERLQRTMDGRFWDEERGGYFNSRADDSHLVLRLKEDYDGAEPAPSSVAAMNLLRLGAIFDEPAGAARYSERGRRTLAAFRRQWTQTPHAMPQMLCALELALAPPRHIVIAGDPGTPEFRALHRAAAERLGRRSSLVAADGGEAHRWLATRAPWLAGMTPRNGRAAAYVCEDFTCQAPVDSPEALRRLLAQ